MAKATDLQTAMQAIGVASPTIPADADLSDVVTTTPESETPAPTNPTPGTPAQADENKATTTTETPESTEAEESSETKDEADEEKQRRSWQSTADKAIAEAQKARAEAEARERELAVERQKNQALMNMLAGINSLRGTSVPAEAAKEPVKAKGEPSLYDFISKDEYDPDEARLPETPSGIAYQKWQDARAEYKEEQRYQARRAREAEEQERQLTFKKANDLAKAYPEYLNPFTGQPDLAKINEFLSDLSKKDWVLLKKALLMAETNGHATTAVPPIPKESVEAAIGKRANKPASVAAQGSAPPAPKEMPEEVKKLMALYGEPDGTIR